MTAEAEAPSSGPEASAPNKAAIASLLLDFGIRSASRKAGKASVEGGMVADRFVLTRMTKPETATSCGSI